MRGYRRRSVCWCWCGRDPWLRTVVLTYVIKETAYADEEKQCHNNNDKYAWAYPFSSPGGWKLEGILSLPRSLCH